MDWLDDRRDDFKHWLSDRSAADYLAFFVGLNVIGLGLLALLGVLLLFK